MSPGFLIIPAIDLMDGRCVRLRQGQRDQAVVYDRDPVEVARQFEANGASRLHLVDLDGAFQGISRNLEIIKAIRHATGLTIQLGGGLRTRQAVEKALDLGMDRVIVGTRALESEDFVKDLVSAIGDRLTVGVDTREGRIATQGWVKTTKTKTGEFVRRLQGLGVSEIIFTDIATDGMLGGPNLKGLETLLKSCNIRVIASGGVAGHRDLESLFALSRKRSLLVGCIIGKAIHDGTISLKATMEWLHGISTAESE